MECGEALSVETLAKRASTINMASGCAVILTGGKELGGPGEDLDCDQTGIPTLELFLRSLFEGDSAFGTDEVVAAAVELEPLDCLDIMEGLETLLRRTFIIGPDATNIKVVTTGTANEGCMGCDDQYAHVPLRERIMGSIVKVDGEYRIRVERTGDEYPDQEPTWTCDNTGVTAAQILRGALTFDPSNNTWFWNTYVI